MKQYSFKRTYRKRWAYRCIALSFLLLIAIFSAFIGLGKYYSHLNNPTLVQTDAEYNKALQNDSYIKIYASKIYDLGIVETETRTKYGIQTSKTDTARFVAIAIDKKLLVVSLPTAKYKEFMAQKSGAYTLEGKLNGFKDDDLAYIKNSLVSNRVSPAQVNLLLYINYLNYETPFSSALIYFIVAGIIFVVTLILFIPVVHRNTSAIRRLKKYSNGDLEMAYQQIDDDANMPDIYKNGPVKITRRYIIVETQSITFAMPLSELVWAYKGTIQHRINGIPTGKTNNLILAFSDKAMYKVEIFKGDKKIDEILQYIFAHSDKTFVGYSKELAAMFKKNFTQFISEWQSHKNNNKQETNQQNSVNI